MTCSWAHNSKNNFAWNFGTGGINMDKNFRIQMTSTEKFIGNKVCYDSFHALLCLEFLSITFYYHLCLFILLCLSTTGKVLNPIHVLNFCVFLYVFSLKVMIWEIFHFQWILGILGFATELIFNEDKINPNA